LFQELLAIWGVSCSEWKQAKPNPKKVASPVQASTASEASPSPSPSVNSEKTGGAKGSAKDRVSSGLLFIEFQENLDE
jgi:hypothetical protein